MLTRHLSHATARATARTIGTLRAMWQCSICHGRFDGPPMQICDACQATGRT